MNEKLLYFIAGVATALVLVNATTAWGADGCPPDKPHVREVIDFSKGTVCYSVMNMKLRCPAPVPMLPAPANTPPCTYITEPICSAPETRRLCLSDAELLESQK